MPPIADLRMAKTSLEVQTRSVDQKHAAYCLAKLATAFNTKWPKEEVAAQLAVWMEANGDLPNDLWSSATIDLIQHHVYGMPKPVHLRASVEAILNTRKAKLRRVLAMIGDDRKPAGKVSREPEDQRLRASIWMGWKHNRMPMAIDAEVRLAKMEGRAPATWAFERAPEPRSNIDPLPSRPDSPATRLALLPSRIRFYRANKQGAYADQLLRDLKISRGEVVEDSFEPAADVEIA